ncbi:MAG TPA: SAM-dependent chlorinase/fluorinase [Gaiellaceae bacterium]
MIITFLTDFGLRDDFVGTCHGVIARIAPGVRVIDVTHGVAPQAVVQGALVLRNTLPYMPVGVHLAVVDPGVGGDRRAIGVQTAEGRLFVGPDNGLLLLAADDVVAAHELANPRLRLPNVSRTFHARDVFAPAAAHLASGVPLAEFGNPIEPAHLVRLDLPEPEIAADRVTGTVLAIDRFGNVATNLRREHMLGAPGSRVEVELPLDRYYATVAETFADASAGELILYEDSYGMITLAISSGDAASLTGVMIGDVVQIARA